MKLIIIVSHKKVKISVNTVKHEKLYSNDKDLAAIIYIEGRALRFS